MPRLFPHDPTFQLEATGGPADVPDATTTVKGKVELATDGENAAGVVVQGNDARLSDARTPTTHSHAPGDITGTAVVTADSRLSDARTPTAHTHAASEVTGTAVVTSDSRLSDARTPTAHSHAPSDVTGTAVVTSDSRLSDARTPTAHSHTKADVSDLGTIGSMAAISDAPSDGSTYGRKDGGWAVPTAALPDLPVVKRVQGADQTVQANYGVVIPGDYEIGSGFVLELAAGAVMEIS